MKNNKLTELSLKEKRQIAGGSDVTDAFWFGIGAIVGTLKSVHRSLQGRDSAHGGMSTWADK